MFVKSYENLASSALNSLKIDKKTVYVVYNSNTDKEYEFDCQNTAEFAELLTKTLKNEESIGKMLHTSIKEGKLVPVTK